MDDILSAVRKAFGCEQIKKPIEFEFLRDLQALSKSTTDWNFKLHACLFSLLIFLAIFVVSKLLFTCISNKFQKFSELDQVYWCETSTNLALSLLVSPFALLVMLKDDYISLDIIHNTSFLSMLILCITIGFLIFEIILQIVGSFFFKTINSVLTGYNTINVIILGLMLHYDYAHFLGCAIMLTHSPIAAHGFSIMIEQFDFIPRCIILKLTTLFRQVSIHVNVYCPLIGAYCLLTTVLQWDIIREEDSALLLCIMYLCVIIEVIIMPPMWAYHLIKYFVQQLPVK